MQRLWIGLALLGAVLCVWLFAFEGVERIATFAAQVQRETQRSMALGLRAIKAGEPGAVLGLMAVCFLYGLAHAAGPGHGKMVLGAYGLAERVALRRLALLAVLSSLTQALTAILLVAIGAAVIGMGRERLGAVADRMLEPLSIAAIAGIGLWLVLRGLRKVMRHRSVAHTHDHKHGAHDHAACASCGHRHGPSLEDVADVRSLRDAVLLVLSIGIRPCTGALFVLILTLQMGIFLHGIAAVIAMAIGTAIVTGLVATGAGLWRESAVRGSGVASQRLFGAVEIGIGLIVVLICASLLQRFL